MANVRGAYDSKPPQAPSSTRSARPCGRDASPGMSAGNWERPRRGGRSLKFCSLTRQAQRRQDDWHRARYGAQIVEIDALFDDDIASAVLDDVVGEFGEGKNRGRILGLIVLDDQFERASKDTALGINPLNGELCTLRPVTAGIGNRAGERHHHADLDRLRRERWQWKSGEQHGGRAFVVSSLNPLLWYCLPGLLVRLFCSIVVGDRFGGAMSYFRRNSSHCGQLRCSTGTSQAS